MKERRGRCIGLIGGLGPGATVHYYKALLRAHAERSVTPDIVIVHADVNGVLGLAGQGDLSGLARYLADIIERLEKAGAALAAIPAVTPHIAMPHLTALSPLPLVSIVDVTRAAMLSRKLRRVALFGTRFTIESDLFGQLSGFEVARPSRDEIDTIHRIYVELVDAGQGVDEQAEALRRIALGLIARESAEAIVLAGTDLASIVDEDRAGYPVVDCARLHIEEITRRAVAEA